MPSWLATCVLWTLDVPIRVSCVPSVEVTMKPLRWYDMSTPRNSIKTSTNL